MIKFTTVAAIGALLLAGSPLALAQTASSPSSSSAPAATPPTTTVPGPQPSEMSAGAQQARAMSEQEAREKLESAGYTSIGDVKADEDGYSATAMKDGKTVKIGVNHDGTVETLK